MNDAVKLNAKAIAGAVVVLLVALLRTKWPDIADGLVQEALRVLIEVVVGSFVVWLVPNSPPAPPNPSSTEPLQ